MTIKKAILIIFSSIFLFFAVAIPTWYVSKSRTFQFFGNLIYRVETQEKVIALTFDDGPTKNTEEVLQIVNDLNIKTTFYLIGSDLEKYPEIGAQINADGHELGNHSYTHTRMVLKSAEFIRKEIDETNKQIVKTGYTGEITFRPPYGKKLMYLPWYLKQNNMKTVMWDIEPETDETIASNKDKIVADVLARAKPGSIILLHPHGPNKQAREAIPEIVNKLLQQGYTFVTVNELLKYQKN